MFFINERGEKIEHDKLEVLEQLLAKQYIEPDDVVFELGARYGTVSCAINEKLKNKTNQVVVEPDARVWDALTTNRDVNKCNFHIIKGFVSNKKLGLINLNRCYGGYGTTSIDDATSTIKSYTMDEIKDKYGLNFNVLVADCEGFLERFFDDNPTFYDNLRMIIFEADYIEKCNYDKIRAELEKRNFVNILSGHQNVWKR